MRKPTKSQRLVALLTSNPQRAKYLMEMLDMTKVALRTELSRLRRQGYAITAEADAQGFRDPRYTLRSGPSSMAGIFSCDYCGRPIRIGHVEDHHESCPFGETALTQVRAQTAQLAEKSNG